MIENSNENYLKPNSPFEPTVQEVKEENKVIWGRVVAATIMNIVFIGVTAFTYQGKPGFYFFFLTIGFIGEYLIMKGTW